MGKSKRNRKKHKSPSVLPVETLSAPLAKKSTAPNLKLLWIILAIVVITGIYLTFHKTKHTAPSQPASSTTQSGLPTVQSGNSQSLSPSGSVDLQPSSSRGSVGSVQ